MNINERVIFEERVENNLLIVNDTANLRRFAKEKKLSFRAEDLLPVLENRYQILSVIRNQRISNFNTRTITNTGEWHYLLKSPEKKNITTTKKTSTNKSIRGRMNKITKT